MAAAATTPAERPLPTIKMTRGARILVAEDNEINQQVVLSMLRHYGAQVRLSVNGEAALQAVQQEPFDLVLMDCEMPRMDGLEATRRIGEWEKTRTDRPRLRIVALTANALIGDLDACHSAGMDDYLSRPVTGAILAGTLARHLGSTHG